ncbi:DUF1918 domain-containing protein [Streptomyces sp. NPDC052013]|uniref:DUF1918 domain-containing protein n=1 Tax=Streptomyces sp. NPDC052013 TaxID=3365679 RepID=UPI0037CEC5FE
MRARVGDVLRFAGRRVGMAEHRAEVLDVLGTDEQPPYRVRYEDGRETEIFLGPGCTVESGEPSLTSPHVD